MRCMLFFLFLSWARAFSYMWTNKAPVVFAPECVSLKKQLAEASHGHRFLLMTDMGDTVKEPVQVRDNLRFLLQMSLLLRFCAGKPIIPVDITYTKYLSEEDRLMSHSHDDIVQCLNLVRGFFQGGMGDLCHFEDWVVEENKEYRSIINQIGVCVRFLETFSPCPSLRMDQYFIGHAGRVEDYERQMTRTDSSTNQSFLCSSHFLWVDDPLHIDHFRGVGNPLGIVATDHTPPGLLMSAMETLNPENEEGKITVIVRMRNIKSKLPRLMDALEKTKPHVLWCCEPTCRSDIYNFLRIHQKRQSVAGGVWVKGRNLDTVQQLVRVLERTPTAPRPTGWNRFSL